MTHASSCTLFGACSPAVLVAMRRARAQNYPNRPITFVVPFAPGGLSATCRRACSAPMMQERIGPRSWSRTSPARRASSAPPMCWRAEPDGYTLLVNALADVQNLHYLPVPYDAVKDFAADRQDHRRAAAGADHQCRAALQDAGRADRRRQGQSEQDQLRHLRSRHLAGDRADPAQRARRHQDR